MVNNSNLFRTKDLTVWSEYHRYYYDYCSRSWN